MTGDYSGCSRPATGPHGVSSRLCFVFCWKEERWKMSGEEKLIPCPV